VPRLWRERGQRPHAAAARKRRRAHGRGPARPVARAVRGQRTAADSGGRDAPSLARLPLAAVAAREAAAYALAHPYKHAIIDGLFPDALCRAAMREIRGFDRWKTWVTPQGRKGGLGGSTDMRVLGPNVEALVDYMQSQPWIFWSSSRVSGT
jgi:hypothetical protein